MQEQDQKKMNYLKENGTFNPNASVVKDELFTKDIFFDSRDIVQVKYEMLRKISKENCSVKKVVYLFGISRPYYYKLKDAFDKKGIAGLLPVKRGPKGAFKFTDDIAMFINRIVEEEPTLTNHQIAQKIEAQFKIIIHPRTIERKRKGQKKRRSGR